MDELLKILEEIKPDVDFKNETALIDDSLLDSFDIVQIVGQLSASFDIEISPNDIVPENFNSAANLWDMIQRLK